MKSNESTDGTKFTMRYWPTKDGKAYIGIVLEVPGAGSQGSTVEELEKNLINAMRALWLSNKADAEAAIKETNDNYKQVVITAN